MAKKRDIYKDCCIEIARICEIAPGWSLFDFIEQEEIDILQANSFYEMLKEYRDQLELINNLIADDDETERIMAEGVRIYSILMKEQMYGEE